MDSTKVMDIVLLLTGLGLVLVGFWMFKSFLIESVSMTKTIFMKYIYDWIVGMVLIILGAGVMSLSENKRLHSFIETISKKE